MLTINDVNKHTKDLSILFIEDHEELRESTTELLRSIFKNVDSCSNGKEGLQQYKAYKETSSNYYDIVLSDIEMPLMNGIDLTENIYQENPSQIVIILSAFDESKYLLRLINLGIEQFIKKPIEQKELLESFVEASLKLTKGISTQYMSDVILAHGVTYNKESKSIKDATENIYLTKFEIIFIELLITSFGKIYSNEDIVLHFLSLDETIDASNIRKLVSKLRKKLPQHSLESIYGIGYKFIPYYE